MNHITLMTDDLTRDELDQLLLIVAAVHRRRFPTPCELHEPRPVASPAKAPALPAAAPKPSSSSPPPPADGRALYKWAVAQKQMPRVTRLGKDWGYPEKVVTWSPDQAASVYRDIIDKPESRSRAAR